MSQAEKLSKCEKAGQAVKSIFEPVFKINNFTLIGGSF